jgi:single-strand DNA-binding protein
MLNKICIIGHLGADPIAKQTGSGKAVSNFSVATSETWKDKQTGEKKKSTEWHRCVAWNKLAEICTEYLQKGSKVYIEGKLRTQKWEKDGVTRYSTEVTVQQLEMLSFSPDSQRGQELQNQRQGQQQNQPQNQRQNSGPNIPM